MSDIELVRLEDGEIDEGAEPSVSTSSPEDCIRIRHDTICLNETEMANALNKSNNDEIPAVKVSFPDTDEANKCPKNKKPKKGPSNPSSSTQGSYHRHDEESCLIDDDEMLCVRGASPLPFVEERRSYARKTPPSDIDIFNKDVSPPKRKKSSGKKRRRKRTSTYKKDSRPNYISSDDDRRDPKLSSSSSSALSSPQQKLHQLCKFYLQGSCAKGRKCEYMHSEFPCKFFYMGLPCEDEISQGSCKLLHGGPLPYEMLVTLIRHIHSAPNDVLGKKFLDLRAKMTPGEASKMLHQVQEQLQPSEEVSEGTTSKIEKNFVASLREKLYFLSEEQIDKLQQLRISKAEDLLSMTLAQLNAIGIHAIQIEAIQMSLIAGKDTDMRNIFPATAAMPTGPKDFFAQGKDVDFRELVGEPSHKWYEQDELPLVIDESEEIKEQEGTASEIIIDVVGDKTPPYTGSNDDEESKDALAWKITPTDQLLLIAEQYEVDTVDTVGSTVEEVAEAAESCTDPAVLQKANAAEDSFEISVEQSNSSMSNNGERSDKAQLLDLFTVDTSVHLDDSGKKLLGTPLQSVDEPLISLEPPGCSDKDEEKAQSSSKNYLNQRIVSEKRQSRFDLEHQVFKGASNNPFHRNATSTAGVTCNQFSSRQCGNRVDINMQGDSSSEDWDADEQSNMDPVSEFKQTTPAPSSPCNSDDETTAIFASSPCPDFPLRTPNLDNYKPALEIEAHLTYPAMEYRLYEIVLPRYEVNKPTFLDKLVKANSSDPRLKRFLEKEKNFGFLPQTDYSFFPPTNNTPCDPRLRTGYTNTCPEKHYNSSPILYGYLQRSLWYQNLKSNLKIQINHSVSDLVRALNAFHKDPSLKKVFDLFQIECAGVLLEFMQNVGIFVDVNGNIIETSNYHQLCAPQPSTSQSYLNGSGSNIPSGAGPSLKPGLLGYAPPGVMYKHPPMTPPTNEKSFVVQAFGNDYEDYNNNGLQPPGSFYIRERNVINRNCGGGNGSVGNSSDFQPTPYRRPEKNNFKRRI